MSIEIYEYQPLDLSVKKVCTLVPIFRPWDEVPDAAPAAEAGAQGNDDVDVETLDDDATEVDVTNETKTVDKTHVSDVGNAEGHGIDASCQVTAAAVASVADVGNQTEVIEPNLGEDRFTIAEAMDFIDGKLKVAPGVPPSRYFGARFCTDEFSDVQEPVPGSTLCDVTGDQYQTREVVVHIDEDNQIECTETTFVMTESPRQFLERQLRGKMPAKTNGRPNVHPQLLEEFLKGRFTHNKVMWLIRHLYSNEDRLKIWWTLRLGGEWNFTVPGCEFILKGSEQAEDVVLITIHCYLNKGCTYHLRAHRGKVFLGVKGTTTIMHDGDNVMVKGPSVREKHKHGLTCTSIDKCRALGMREKGEEGIPWGKETQSPNGSKVARRVTGAFVSQAAPPTYHLPDYECRQGKQKKVAQKFGTQVSRSKAKTTAPQVTPPIYFRKTKLGTWEAIC